MDKPKASLYVAFFCYGGNGGIAAMSPDLAMWWAKTYHWLKTQPQIDFKGAKVYSDTPITMTRNEAVEDAKLLKADMVLMLDSDNIPDGYLGHYSSVKPFLPTAYDFAYERLLKGIPTVIAAPYCGPPPPPVDKPGTENFGEVPYLFQWTTKESDCDHAPKKLSILTRAEAARLAGIHPMAALPTGVCLFTLNAFEGLPQPYFKYEMNEAGSQKKSTEDVVATRDISVFWSITKGWDVVYAACDSWAFHVKTKKVGRPQFLSVDSIAGDMVEAIRRNWTGDQEVRHIDFTQDHTPEFHREDAVGLARPESLKRGYVIHGPLDPARPPPPENIQDIPTRWSTIGPNDHYVRVSQQDWEDAEQVAKSEAAASVAPRDPPFPDNDTDLDDTDIDVDDGVSPIVATNGQLPLRAKMIGQKRMAILEYELADSSIDSLQSMTRWLVAKLGGGIDVAIVHPGTGQGTAAIAECLPGMSRILAFDSTSQYHSGEYAKHFKLAFEKELENGVIKADVDGKAFPSVKNYQVDLAFIENFVTGSKLEACHKAVSPKGMLCGTGYSQEGTKAVITAFSKKHELPVQANGDLWVIPVGGIASVNG